MIISSHLIRFNNSFNLHLIFDFLRGFAALIVFLGHVRGVFYPSFSELVEVDIYDYVLYFITGYGHQAVIVFFFLSGYFIQSSLSKFRLSYRTYTIYIINRYFRFFSVLLPALILTLLLDKIAVMGLSRFHYGELNDLVSPNSPVDLSFLNFFINLANLQAMSFSTFGSNSPLWSLSYEFIYYLIWPILLFKSQAKYLIFCLFVLLISFFNVKVLLLFPCWLFGVLFYFCKYKSPILISSLFLILTLIIVRIFQLGVLGDYLLSVSLFFFFSSVRDKIEVFTLPSGLKKLCKSMSNMSFPLYIVHMPIIGFFVYLGDKYSLLMNKNLVAMLCSVLFIAYVFHYFDKQYYRLSELVITKVGLR